MQASILARHLKAAMCCSAIQDVRYYLNGVHVEVLATETRCVATDGYVAAVLRTRSPNDDRFTVTIPNETIKLALASKSKVLPLSCVDSKWSLGNIGFTPVDGIFPDYRRIMVSHHSGEAAQFNIDKLVQFVKVGKALSRRDIPIIRHNGRGSAQVQYYGCDEFVGVIMPLNAFTEKRPDTGLITWGADRAA